VSGHERILLLAATAIDFPLSAGETDELEAHLRSCDRCRTEAEQLRGDAAMIAALPSRQPSDEVGRRIVEAAMGRSRSGLRPMLILVAAALLVATLLGAAIVGALLTRTPEMPISIVPPSIPATVPTANPSAPAPTATPAPTTAPGEAWRVVTPAGSPGMSGVVAGGPGWIGVGGGAWTSTDGRTWTPAVVEGVDPCPGPDRCLGMTEVAAGVGGFVAIGEDPTALRDGKPQSGLIWHSTDGLTWAIVGSGPEFELGACIEGCPSMTDVAGGPSGYVALGYRVTSESPLRTAVVAWFSPDGLQWETLPGDTFDVAGSAVNLSAVAAGPSGFVVAGSTEVVGASGTMRPGFWVSPDGRGWTHVGPDEVTEPTAEPDTVVAGGPGYVAIGGCRDGDNPCAVAWTSPDGRTWTERSIDAAEGAAYGSDGAASDGDRVIAFTDSGTAVWTSDDGIEWTRQEVNAPALGIDAAAGGDHGFIAMGLDKAETGFYTWLSP
jgi:hypothetical protein